MIVQFLLHVIQYFTFGMIKSNSFSVWCSLSLSLVVSFYRSAYTSVLLKAFDPCMVMKSSLFLKLSIFQGRNQFLRIELLLKSCSENFYHTNGLIYLLIILWFEVL